uniref:hypothetical protein n=1 Tax=Salmonella enterica TaxID=28901 RepID=UPI00398C258D
VLMTTKSEAAGENERLVGGQGDERDGGMRFLWLRLGGDVRCVRLLLGQDVQGRVLGKTARMEVYKREALVKAKRAADEYSRLTQTEDICTGVQMHLTGYWKTC